MHVCIYMVYLSPGVIKKIHCDTLQHTATHCQNTLQQTETKCNDWTLCVTWSYNKKDVFTVIHCNTLQHCNTATLCVTWSYTTHCNTLQHTATHCNTLQHCVSPGAITKKSYSWALRSSVTRSSSTAASISQLSVWMSESCHFS